MAHCFILRRYFQEGGTSYVLPSDYTKIDYVICGSGTYQQSGFFLYNYSSYINDTVEIVTTTPTTTTESGFMGFTGSEAYYENGDIYGYGSIVKQSNTATQIEGNTVTKNTTIYSISSTSAQLSIGYYRLNQYKYQGRIYSVIISRPTLDATGNPVAGSSVVLNNLVPCYRNSDNVAGMFDLVYQVFYTSSQDAFAIPS